MRFALKLFVLLFVSILFLGCNSKEDKEIKIGFIAGLSGKYSSLGISVRDGFLLAFDEINYRIDGKHVVVIEKDDKQDVKEAKKAIKYFLNNDIKLVVGNATSSMTKISLEEINKHENALLLSATASGDEFTHKDDNFLRIQVENSEKRYKTLLKHIKSKGYQDIFFIYDSRNISYINGYEKIFQKMFIKDGGKEFVGSIDLNTQYNKILEQLQLHKNDLIMIVGNSIDTANIIQYIRHNKITTDILGSGWAKTIDFITNGGKAVEGVYFSTSYDDNAKDTKFIEFANKFEKKYNKKASAFAAQGYELGQILIQNLQKSSNIETLKQRILDIEKYKGLQGDIVFDKYGDIQRDYFMIQVIHKSFQKID